MSAYMRVSLVRRGGRAEDLSASEAEVDLDSLETFFSRASRSLNWAAMVGLQETDALEGVVGEAMLLLLLLLLRSLGVVVALVGFGVVNFLFDELG
jgi:hypothetical protein